MAQFSRTWWGKRFIAALEKFSDPARLGRGRSYASGGKILDYQVNKNKITATVRGSINHYYGIHKEPRYSTTIEIKAIKATQWSQVIKVLSSRASFVSKLLMNEVPDNIESVFSELGLHLLPYSERDFKTNCSCPDWANPCKHIAGVYYLVASQLDHNPFLLFELRGLSKEDLQRELSKSPLGRVLSDEIAVKETSLSAASSYFPPLEKVEVAQEVNSREFWLGSKRLPARVEPISSSSLPAILIKKQGDFPAFWHEDVSFIQVMEELYERVRTKNKDIF
ncbi:SWIM zinc finger family protein [Floridanema evergladense]|uniref:SWIM zinc finger family protein n=1 Tax=Floridaenema evergladense BLCC-F167 TaxID=3153639 RepID=A0ABV4WUC8_9CYAN